MKNTDEKRIAMKKICRYNENECKGLHEKSVNRERKVKEYEFEYI